MIPINFATKDYRLLSWVRLCLHVGSAVMLVVMAVILWRSASLRGDITSLDGQIKRLEAADKDILPVLAERDRFVKDLADMSGLLESRKFSWTHLLTNIEAVVPSGVALSRVDYSPKGRTLALDGTAQSPESLRNLVVAMEKSPVFKDPLLKHQSVEKGSISFNVVSTYHEGPVAAVVQGKQ